MLSVFFLWIEYVGLGGSSLVMGVESAQVFSALEHVMVDVEFGSSRDVPVAVVDRLFARDVVSSSASIAVQGMSMFLDRLAAS